MNENIWLRVAEEESINYYCLMLLLLMPLQMQIPMLLMMILLLLVLHFSSSCCCCFSCWFSVSLYKYFYWILSTHRIFLPSWKLKYVEVGTCFYQASESSQPPSQPASQLTNQAAKSSHRTRSHRHSLHISSNFLYVCQFFFLCRFVVFSCWDSFGYTSGWMP